MNSMNILKGVNGCYATHFVIKKVKSKENEAKSIEHVFKLFARPKFKIERNVATFLNQILFRCFSVKH